MNATFYGFQFPHHGRFSAFSALSGEMSRAGVDVLSFRFPSPPLWLPGRIRRSLSLMAYRASERRLKHRFDTGALVHYFFPENSLINGSKWKKSGPLVLSCHQPQEKLEQMRNAGFRGFFDGLRKADGVVLMSSCGIDDYRKFATDAHVVCIPHGVDTDFFHPAAVSQGGGDRFRILTVGNWLRDYGLWAEVVERACSDFPEVEFSVLANQGQLAIATAGLGESRRNVRILNGISDEQLRDEYQRADVIFLPLTDAWANNALLEAMACGRPIVATDLPAVREYADHAARFVEKGSVDSAITEIVRLKDDSIARRELEHRARERAMVFSWERITAQHLRFYSELGIR